MSTYTYWREKGMQPGDVVKVARMWLPPNIPMPTPYDGGAPLPLARPQQMNHSATVKTMNESHLLVTFEGDEATHAIPYEKILGWWPRSELGKTDDWKTPKP